MHNFVLSYSSYVNESIGMHGIHGVSPCVPIHVSRQGCLLSVYLSMYIARWSVIYRKNEGQFENLLLIEFDDLKFEKFDCDSHFATYNFQSFDFHSTKRPKDVFSECVQTMTDHPNIWSHLTQNNCNSIERVTLVAITKRTEN